MQGSCTHHNELPQLEAQRAGAVQLVNALHAEAGLHTVPCFIVIEKAVAPNSKFAHACMHVLSCPSLTWIRMLMFVPAKHKAQVGGPFNNVRYGTSLLALHFCRH